MRPWVSNLGLKLLSLFLAFVVWLVVSAPRRENVSERAFAAPLSLIGIPRELVITTSVPDTVNVRLRGRASDLRTLSSQNLEVTLDLRWIQPGDAQVTLRPQAINVPQLLDEDALPRRAAAAARGADPAVSRRRAAGRFRRRRSNRRPRSGPRFRTGIAGAQRQ